MCRVSCVALVKLSNVRVPVPLVSALVICCSWAMSTGREPWHKTEMCIPVELFSEK